MLTDISIPLTFWRLETQPGSTHTYPDYLSGFVLSVFECQLSVKPIVSWYLSLSQVYPESQTDETFTYHPKLGIISCVDTPHAKSLS